MTQVLAVDYLGWSTAVGTVAAVFVALFAAPAWVWLRRPKFAFGITGQEPHFRSVTDPRAGLPGDWLRLEVKNHGGHARNARAELHRWLIKAPEEDTWCKHDIDPVLMHWVSLPRVGEARYALVAPELTLVKGSRNFIDVCRYDRSKGQIVLDPHEPRPRGFVNACSSPGRHQLEILVSADGARPRRWFVYFDVSPTGKLSGVRGSRRDEALAPTETCSAPHMAVTRFAEKRIPLERDVVAPDGSDVRHLLALSRGGVAQFELAPNQTSVAVRHRTVDEIWVVTGGRGEMWRRESTHEETVNLKPGVCVTIPAGTDFQFRSQGTEPLVVIGVTMPPWPGRGEAELAEGRWRPTLKPGPD